MITKEAPTLDEMVPIAGVVNYSLIPEYDLIRLIEEGEIVGADPDLGVPKRLFKHWEQQTDHCGEKEEIIRFEEAVGILNKPEIYLLLIAKTGLKAEKPDREYNFLEYNQGKLRFRDSAVLQYTIPEEFSRDCKCHRIRNIFFGRDAIMEWSDYLKSCEQSESIQESVKNRSILFKKKGNAKSFMPMPTGPIVFCYHPSMKCPDTQEYAEIPEIKIAVYIEKSQGKPASEWDSQYDSELMERILGRATECVNLQIGLKRRVARFEYHDSNVHDSKVYYHMVILDVPNEKKFLDTFPVAINSVIGRYDKDEIQILNEATKGFPFEQHRQDVFTITKKPEWFDKVAQMYIDHHQQHNELKVPA